MERAGCRLFKKDTTGCVGLEPTNVPVDDFSTADSFHCFFVAFQDVQEVIWSHILNKIIVDNINFIN